MFTDEEMNQMIMGSNVVAPEATADNNTEATPEVLPDPIDPSVTTGTEAPAEINVTEVVQENINASDETRGVVPSDTIASDQCVSVSDVILNNIDKHIKMVVLNAEVHTKCPNADVVNYIAYVNTEKNIPCLFDCEGLCVPSDSVKNADGTWNITSIEGRRSGFVIKTPARDLVMTKNFVYDCKIENGAITEIKIYNRKHKIENLTVTTCSDYDSAALVVQSVLPKIVKCGKYKTIEELREQVVHSYDTVNDVNALFKIVELRLTIGC